MSSYSAFPSTKLTPWRRGVLLSKEKWAAVLAATKAERVENLAALDGFFLPVVGPNAPPECDLEFLELKWKEEKDKTVRAELREVFYTARREAAAYAKNSPKCEGRAAINYGSPTQLKKALYRMGFTPKELPNTNDKTLERVEGAVIKALQASRTTDKLIDASTPRRGAYTRA